jgi:hypothetical protein
MDGRAVLRHRGAWAPSQIEGLTKGSVRKEGDGFLVEVEMEGASAKELNRMLLSALRKVGKRTKAIG